jgi:hypothetical protein
MIPIHLALATRTKRVKMNELARVAAALQMQITRDFAPIWHVDATIGAFPLDDIPTGYWPIIVQDGAAPPEADGLHFSEADSHPYALVRHGPNWSLSASHEVLEMLADPTGSRTVAGMSPLQGQGRVEFLVQVCAPCGDSRFAYCVNDVIVSDFHTPRYFEPVASPRTSYSFRGAIERPREVLAHGSLSWLAGSGVLFQARANANGAITVTDHGPVSGRFTRPLREYASSLTPGHHRRLSNAVLDPLLADTRLAAIDAGRIRSRDVLAEIVRRFGGVAEEMEEQGQSAA